MLTVLKNLFQTKKTSSTVVQPIFLTTHALNFYIEKLIQESQEYIYILSPYIKLCTRLEELLLERKKAGVNIIVLCRIESIQNSIEHIASEIKDRKNLHAKAFLSENAAIVGSLNLYDFSQINNDEMGFYCSKDEGTTLYSDIKNDVERIYNVSASVYTERQSTEQAPPIKQEQEPFELGKRYTLEELDARFDFEYKKPSGIKTTQRGNILLFMNSNSAYGNKENQNVVYFEGQNTGNGPQQLIYGNKQLYDAYNSLNIRIFLFKHMCYAGEHHICKKPFMHNGKWIFPLAIKK